VTPIAPDASEPNNTRGQATALGSVVSTSVGGLSLHDGGDIDDFSFRAARVGIYQVTASGTTIRVLDGSGRLVASGAGKVAFRSRRARSPFVVEIGAPGGVPVATYTLAIAPQAPGRPGILAGARRPGRAIRR
jgi:hypothetical protein